MGHIPLVIATGNAGKAAEIRELLAGFPVAIKFLGDFGPLPPITEDGETFEANAYKKASFTARVLGMPALADDSGLVVAALDGRPGVLSARYGESDWSDAQRAAQLLAEMKGQTDRRAAFECVISVAVPDGPALTYEGCCQGEIAAAPAGENGFGYDPIFYYPPLKKTFAQMDRETKSSVSHRGQALEELRDYFDKVLKWIELQMPLAQWNALKGGGE
jgi:XTP/dITP diphosphohydrolase